MGLLGGFVASNTEHGRIEDCYCVLRFNGRNTTAGGFAGDSKGNISNSFCEDIARGLTGGFAGNPYSNPGKNCYFLCDSENRKKKKDALWDSDRALVKEQLLDEKKAAQAGFDMEQTWAVNRQRGLLQFADGKWMQRVEETQGAKKVLVIRSADDLVRFSEMVNSGDKRLIDARVRLDEDIDLQGKAWIPVGKTRANAFRGIFDGNGHTVHNFVIKGDDFPKKGFFGYLRGQVYNLTIDCVIKGEGDIGGIAAVNEGVIGCCGAIVSLQGKGKEYHIGGLTGINSGHIFKSYAAGKIRFLVIPILPVLVLLSGITVLSAAVGKVIPNMGEQPVYNPVASDPNQIKNDKNPDQDVDASGGQDGDGGQEVYTVSDNRHTIAFTFDEEILVSLSTGACELNFENPKYDDHKLVVELQFSDAVATEVLGSTGRTNVAQAACEAKADYDPETYRVSLAKSGAVDPGYGIACVYLNDFAQANLSPGEYSGYVSLTPYDEKTNNKSMIETELPVTIVVIE